MKMCCWNAIKFIKILLLAIALFNLDFQSNTQAFSINKNANNEFMERAIFALEKVLHYYKHNYDTINVDSLLGVRVTEGILRKILMHNTNVDGKLDAGKKKLISVITKMYLNVKDISEKSLPIVRDDNVQAFRKFYKIISKPWQLFIKFHKLNQRTMGRKQLQKIIFDGPTSDYCISLLLEDRNGYSSCNITDLCWMFETRKNADGYTPTHQVLYFLFGLGENCQNNFNKKFQETDLKNNANVQDFLNEICSNILQTANTLWQDGENLMEIEKDLFMEQTLVCSLAGYEDFLNEKYFDMILGWQTNVGCFGTQVYVKGIRRYTTNLKKEPPTQGLATTRKLQYAAKWLQDGCINHETGVGVALLAQYVRWLLETKM